VFLWLGSRLKVKGFFMFDGNVDLELGKERSKQSKTHKQVVL